MVTSSQNISETLIDAAYYSLSGATLGNLAKWVRLPSSDSLTPGHFVIGGILNAAFMGAGKTLFKNEAKSTYKSGLITGASLAASCFSAPFLTAPFPIKLTLQEAAIVATFNLACKGAKSCFSSLKTDSDHFAKRKTQLESCLKSKDLTWGGLDPSIHQDLEKYFISQESEATLLDMQEIELRSLEMTLLWKLTDNEPLSKEKRTALNNLFYNQDFPPQVKTREGDPPVILVKELQANTHPLFSDYEWPWIFEHPEVLPEGVKIQALLEKVFPKNLDEARNTGFFLASKFKEYISKDRHIPLAFRTIFNLSYGDLFSYDRIQDVNIERDLLQNLKDYEIQDLYEKTNTITLSRNTRTLLNDYFYSLNRPPQQRARDGLPSGKLRKLLNSVNFTSFRDLSDEEKEWARIFSDWSENDSIRIVISFLMRKGANPK